MRIELARFAASLPLPATPIWPTGVWDIEAFRHGTMSVVLFTPRGTDHQSSHDQDELYVVVDGSGVLVVDGERQAFVRGDVLFVPARAQHPLRGFHRGPLDLGGFLGAEGRRADVVRRSGTGRLTPFAGMRRSTVASVRRVR